MKFFICPPSARMIDVPGFCANYIKLWKRRVAKTEHAKLQRVSRMVSLVQVANEQQATYVLKGTAEEKKAGWAKIAFTGNIHSDDAASVQLIDRRTGAIVFAYAVDKKNTLHGEQTTAEACAKHLNEAIEKK